jgi:mono/diheme cytochrome c family protein
MFGIVRYSFTVAVVASLCAVALGGEGAFGLPIRPRVPDGFSVELVTYRGGSRTASGTGESLQAGYDAAKGQDLYTANCSACHLANGEGIPGAFPPLKGSGAVNKDDASKHIQVVLNGMQGARAGGVVYASAMPPFAGVLSDAEIADIIDYERSSWGNHGKPVNAAQVAAERALPK